MNDDDGSTTLLTYPTRTYINVMDPRADQFHLIDIAWGLARENRFANQTRVGYTVAQHCIAGSLVAEKVYGPREAFRMLLHDAAEAYLRDIPGPVKKLLPEYQKIEARWDAAIATRFGMSCNAELVARCKGVDKALGRAEDVIVRGLAPKPESPHPRSDEFDVAQYAEHYTGEAVKTRRRGRMLREAYMARFAELAVEGRAW